MAWPRSMRLPGGGEGKQPRRLLRAADRLARQRADGRFRAADQASTSPIAAWDWGSYFPLEQRLKGIRLTLAQYRRPDPATAPAKAKAAGLYMICTIEKHRAERAGYADALMFDWRGRVAECTGANIFFIKDGVMHTPVPDCFLDGITRRTVIGLAKARGLEVVERVIMPDELGSFSECFVTGTAAEVTPVSEIAEVPLRPGPTPGGGKDHPPAPERRPPSSGPQVDLARRRSMRSSRISMQSMRDSA